MDWQWVTIVCVSVVSVVVLIIATPPRDKNKKDDRPRG